LCKRLAPHQKNDLPFIGLAQSTIEYEFLYRLKNTPLHHENRAFFTKTHRAALEKLTTIMFFEVFFVKKSVFYR